MNQKNQFTLNFSEFLKTGIQPQTDRPQYNSAVRHLTKLPSKTFLLPELTEEDQSPANYYIFPQISSTKIQSHRTIKVQPQQPAQKIIENIQTSVIKQKVINRNSSLPPTFSHLKLDELRFKVNNNKNIFIKKDEHKFNFNRAFLQLQRTQRNLWNKSETEPPALQEARNNFMKKKYETAQKHIKISDLSENDKLDYSARIIEHNLSTDCIISIDFKINFILIVHFFQHGIPDKLHQAHKNLLAIIYDKQIFFGQQELRLVHQHLNIKNIHFDHFKCHFLKQLLSLQAQQEVLLKCCANIEKYRSSILNRPCLIDLVRGDKGINQLSIQFYKRVFTDYNLAQFFINIDLETQALKFSKIFQQIINGIDSPNYPQEILRQRHQHYELTHVHYAIFKQNLNESLYELNLPEKTIWDILQMMDAYKSSIINQDSIKDLVNKVGFEEFIVYFTKLCLNDQIFNLFVQKRGIESFTIHAKNMFHHFFNRQIMGFTLHDIKSIHDDSKTIIPENIFDQFKSNTFLLIKQLKPHQIILEDFEEDWEEIRPLLIRSHLPFQKAGGWKKVNFMIQEIIDEIIQKSNLLKIYTDNEVNPKKNISRKFKFLMCGKKFFKKSDITVLHQKLHITNAIFDEFLKTVIKGIKQCDKELMWVAELVENWRPCIVSG